MAYFTGADKFGNPIMFDPGTGDVIQVSVVAGGGGGPPPPPPPPPAPGGAPGRSGLGPKPTPTGGCWTTLADVYRWFIEFLGGPPQDDADAIGYGRIGLPCDQVISEIQGSQEAQNYRASGQPAPGRVAAALPPGTVAPPAGSCPTGQHQLFGVGPCVPATIGPELPPGLSQVLQEILAELGTLTHDATKDVTAIAGDVAVALGGRLDPLVADIHKISAQVQGALGGALTGLPAQVAELVGAGFGGIESLVSAFLTNAASVDDVAGAAVKAVQGQQGGLFTFLLGLIMSGGSAIAGQTIAALQTGAPRPRLQTGAPPATGPGIAPELDVPFTQLTDPRDPLVGAAQVAEVALGAIAGMLAFLEPGSELVRQYAWSVTPDKLVDSGTAVGAEVRGFIAPNVAEEISRRGGLDAYMHAIEREIAKARPDTGALFSAWHRDEIDTEQLLRGLARLGFDGEARDVLIAIARTLLGPDALARLSDRDLARLGGSPTFAGIEEITTEFVREGLDAGYSKDDIDRAWNLHYQPPDVGAAAEMLHRGAITIENYRDALRANAVPPEWRPAYEVAAFVPFSRRDWLRLVQHGLLDHAALVRAIMDNGYTEPRAEIIATVLEKIAAETKKTAKDPQRAPLTAQHLALYEDGVRSRSVTEQALAALEHAPDAIAALLSEADMRREVKRVAEVVRLVKPLYVQGAWDWPRASSELTSWGLDDDHQAELLREWDLARALVEQKPHQLKAHELTVAELTTAFVDGEVTEANYRARLAALRFDEQDIELEVLLAQTKRHKAEQADKVAEIEHALLGGAIDEPTASDALDAIGVTPGKRDRLLDGWLKTHANRRVELTVAQLTALLGAAIIDETDLHDYMMMLPYGDTERTWLEALVGSKAAAAQARAASATAKAAKVAAAAASVAVP